MKIFLREIWCYIVHNHRPYVILKTFKIPYVHAECERCGYNMIKNIVDNKNI